MVVMKSNNCKSFAVIVFAVVCDIVRWESTSAGDCCGRAVKREDIKERECFRAQVCIATCTYMTVEKVSVILVIVMRNIIACRCHLNVSKSIHSNESLLFICFVSRNEKNEMQQKSKNNQDHQQKTVSFRYLFLHLVI